jgi:DNA/RNA-binding domain of Phe-tRNA-synthetase-like protein
VSLRIECSRDLAPLVVPVTLAFDDVRVVARDPRVDGPMAATAARILADAADLEPIIAAVRSMYRGIGIDPTKVRPSSEALLRRLRKGESLPRVNSLVDVCNWCSLETQLPFGLYDRACIEGDVVVIRRGREGEGYEGIRKDHVNVGGRLTIADAVGPFGNPTSDSARTMVTLHTTRALFVLYAPAATPRGVLERAAALTVSRVTESCGGVLAERGSA